MVTIFLRERDRTEKKISNRKNFVYETQCLDSQITDTVTSFCSFFFLILYLRVVRVNNFLTIRSGCPKLI